jgi:hypothetical protein
MLGEPHGPLWPLREHLKLVLQIVVHDLEHTLDLRN